MKLAAIFLFLLAALVRADTTAVVQVDCASWIGPPLSKTKLGVYQTPLHPQEDQLKSMILLAEAEIREFRYELGWGKPDAVAWDQITGTPEALSIDFDPLDRLLDAVAAASARPLLSLGYCPAPLQTHTDWSAWKDMPGNLASWCDIVTQYAKHLREVSQGIRYEVWNEPDLALAEGKVFFTGGPEDYRLLYKTSVDGLAAGAPEACAGGPGLAWDHAYSDAMLRSGAPVDFLSVHAYGDPRWQLDFSRGVLRDRPDLPILLTEYASYQDFGLEKPISRHPAAARFFADMKILLEYPDCPTVYWAQWIDDPLGVLTNALQPKASYNAMKLYQTLLPTDRCLTKVQGAEGIDALAGCSENQVGVAVWNTSLEASEVRVELAGLVFAKGNLRVYRLDSEHGSYLDAALTCDLTPVEELSTSGEQVVWSGRLPAESVVFLALSDTDWLEPSRPEPPGLLSSDKFWFEDRVDCRVAEFDPRTGVARLGMGASGQGIALVGSVLRDPLPVWQITAKRQSAQGLLGLRLDFASAEGEYHRSVLLWTGEAPGQLGERPWPWGTKRPPDQSLAFIKGSCAVNLKQIAPPDWPGREVLVSFLLKDAGPRALANLELLAFR